jgi:hypothetical protein
MSSPSAACGGVIRMGDEAAVVVVVAVVVVIAAARGKPPDGGVADGNEWGWRGGRPLVREKEGTCPAAPAEPMWWGDGKFAGRLEGRGILPLLEVVMTPAAKADDKAEGVLLPLPPPPPPPREPRSTGRACPLLVMGGVGAEEAAVVAVGEWSVDLGDAGGANPVTRVLTGVVVVIVGAAASVVATAVAMFGAVLGGVVPRWDNDGTTNPPVGCGLPLTSGAKGRVGRFCPPDKERRRRSTGAGLGLVPETAAAVATTVAAVAAAGGGVLANGGVVPSVDPRRVAGMGVATAGTPM